jgi:hypothetical protein
LRAKTTFILVFVFAGEDNIAGDVSRTSPRGHHPTGHRRHDQGRENLNRVPSLNLIYTYCTRSPDYGTEHLRLKYLFCYCCYYDPNQPHTFWCVFFDQWD